jgi:hypothetical protein
MLANGHAKAAPMMPPTTVATGVAPGIAAKKYRASEPDQDDE